MPVHSVAVTLSHETHADEGTRSAEARAVGSLVNDLAFQAAVIEGLKTVGEEILERAAPGSTDAFSGNQYVAISTDLVTLSSTWQKGDRMLYAIETRPVYAIENRPENALSTLGSFAVRVTT